MFFRCEQRKKLLSNIEGLQIINREVIVVHGGDTLHLDRISHNEGIGFTAELGDAINHISVERLANLTADKIQVTELGAITANLGNIYAGSINMNSGYSVIRTSGKTFGNGQQGFFLERLADGGAAVEFQTANARLYMTPTAFGIETPGLKMYGTGYVELNALNVVKTLQIAGNSVTTSASFTSSVNVWVPYGGTAIVIAYGPGGGGFYSNTKSRTLSILVNGNAWASDVAYGFIQEGTVVNQWIINGHSVMALVPLGAGTHTFGVTHEGRNSSHQPTGAPTPSAAVFVMMR